ncbi:hypothetical protein [Streptomyces sp. cmx-18-6]|uniref:hypothetical protein n=1 Tax=Streptomyces sp. cmx-18-6 TaxID=2790930 RepID=UPI00397EF3D6
MDRGTAVDATARRVARYGERPARPLTPWPALDEVLGMEIGSKRFAVLALPWEPGGETPFHIAQAAARSGANPLCLHPGWSPHWDGALRVRRTAELPAEVAYRDLAVRGGEVGMVLVDQFSRLHWGSVTGHHEREDVVGAAGRELLELALKASLPVLVLVRSRKGGPLDFEALRSDGALEYDCDVFAMADPDHRTATARLRVAKSRFGPAETTTVAWEVLPRTHYRGAAGPGLPAQA